jgi:hypothetical protein
MRIALRALSPLAAALALAAAGPAEARTSCAAAGSSTVRENSVARVYQSSDDELIACSKRTGRRVDLVGPEDRFSELRLRGHYVAYGYESCVDALGDECTFGIELVHVARGRSEFRAGALVERVALRRSGALAWSEDEGSDRSVHRRDRAGRRRLDSGVRLDAASLRLRGSTLSWVNDGVRRTAPLR